jgi:hypothetical protein
MSRRYRSEPIEVVTDTDGEPAQFRWRGRRYVVGAIVTSWVEALPWWAGDSRSADIPVGDTRAEGASGQRHVWRVEAAARTGTTGVYDLYRVTQGRQHWGLARVID